MRNWIVLSIVIAVLAAGCASVPVAGTSDCGENSIVGRWEGDFIDQVTPMSIWGSTRVIDIRRIGEDAFSVNWGLPKDQYLTAVLNARVERYSGCQWRVTFKDPWSSMTVDLWLTRTFAGNVLQGSYAFPGKPYPFQLHKTAS
jgi:hypothetical protein